MRQEVEAAANFLGTLLTRSGQVSGEKVVEFQRLLVDTFEKCYVAGWHPAEPLRGSGNRCLRIHPFKMDPLLAEVAEIVGISHLSECLPKELTLWVDPGCVCYRTQERGPLLLVFGDENAINANETKTPSPKTQSLNFGSAFVSVNA
eukprot:comp8203_c0_seq1/m.3648 comp8203_c0_seq1/g.3648  ORF comp8203_c0_seq1/g.3648 comp8203_c0_seq1/m.3648 type:complete len:147 (-) comp8203_c0_seq1:25-465(-)